jgi:hypothetical protein
VVFFASPGEVIGFGGLRKHENGEQHGVESCTGVCTCHSTESCSCGNLPVIPMLQDSPRDNPKRKQGKARGSSDALDQSMSYNVLDHPLEVFETAEPKCDQQCVLQYSAASGVVTVLIISIVVFAWKRK